MSILFIQFNVVVVFFFASAALSNRRFMILQFSSFFLSSFKQKAKAVIGIVLAIYYAVGHRFLLQLSGFRTFAPNFNFSSAFFSPGLLSSRFISLLSFA